MAHSKSSYDEIITEAANLALAHILKSFKQENLDMPDPSKTHYFARVMRERVGNERLSITALRVDLKEAITENTFEYAQEIEAEEQAEWDIYSRNRPDRMSARDFV
jgi:hypothetical protein